MGSARTGSRLIGALCWLVVVILAGTGVRADDWPEWRGKGRAGVWSEAGILERFPDAGLKVRWRAPVRKGYAGPAVAGGRVFVTDANATSGRQVTERVLCLDESTGKILWSHEWVADYTGLTYSNGPRATPTVDNDSVYVLGAVGNLFALEVATGKVRWQKDYRRDYKATLPPWGFASAPLVDGNRLIAVIGGEPDAKVVAFNKVAGNEIWRALRSDSEPGYSQPIIATVGNTRQLIVWHATAVTSLDPEKGHTFWEHPLKAQLGMAIATPVVSGRRLMVSSFYNGSVMFELDDKKPAARVLWKGNSESEIQTDGLHALFNTPSIQDGFIYGICSYGQLRGLNAETGERIWATQAVTKERARFATGWMVRSGNRLFINNDRGDLIIATVSPEGYREISRTHLIKPTTDPGNRRELGAVNWTHPAYANRHIYARNDEEIISASLAAEESKTGSR
jgi:outer membrane protein assembly factor BamB